MPPKGYKKRQMRWTKEEVIEAAHRWQETYGEPPTAVDWAPSDSRARAREGLLRVSRWMERARRFEEGYFPWTGTVSKLFGTWNNMLREANLEVRWQSKAPCILPSPPRGPGALIKLAERAALLEGDRRKEALYRLAERALALAESN